MILKQQYKNEEKIKEVTISFSPETAHNLLSSDQKIHFFDIENGKSFTPEVFAPLWESRWCFLFGFYLASISQISSSVEIAINSDIRLKAEKNKTKNNWLMLNKQTFQLGIGAKLPISFLLKQDEILDDRIKSKPLFVERRNKIAHGDIADKSFSDIWVNSEKAQQESLEHLIMGQDFLLNWAQSEGNPANKKENITMNPGTVIRMLYDSKTLGFVNPYNSSRWSGA